MPTLLEASLQIHLIFPPFRLVDTLLWVLRPMFQVVSVHDTHVVNAVCTLLLEVPDKKVAFMFCDLWRLHYGMFGSSACPGWRSLRPLHGAT